MVRLPSIRVMQRAFAERDASFDGTFYVAVKTTGIFCRPICRAKPPKLQNIEFFPTAQAAMRHGYRPCKLCKPLGVGKPSPLVQRLIDLVEHKPGKITERMLRENGIEPTTARRQFKTHFRMTFTAWQRSRRLGKAIKTLNNGANMTTAQLTADFDSASGFRDALGKIFSVDRAQIEAAEILTAEQIATPLGSMLAVANDGGLVMLDFVQKDGFDAAVARLKNRLENSGQKCAIVPGENRHIDLLTKELAEYFTGKRRDFTVRLAPVGSEFEQKVWDYLRAIPYAETRSYGQQARAIGRPTASRAVGAANGRNNIAILIPCHRVIGAGGSLTGYAGGLERKRWLLNHERDSVGMFKS